MKKVVAEGRTVEEAIEKALAELNATNDQVDKKILEMPSKGIMGIFGVKNAKVEVSIKEPIDFNYFGNAKEQPIKETRSNVPIGENANKPVPVKEVPEKKEIPLTNEIQQTDDSDKDIEKVAVDFLDEIFEKFGVDAVCNTTYEHRNLNVVLEGSNMGILIGRRGQTLDAIQYLTSLVVNKVSDEYIRVVIDTENYREKREVTLKELAFKLAKKVERTRKKVVLEPMNPYERRIIHATLQNNKKVYTYSEGEEPFRKVVIDLKKTS